MHKFHTLGRSRYIYIYIYMYTSYISIFILCPISVYTRWVEFTFFIAASLHSSPARGHHTVPPPRDSEGDFWVVQILIEELNTMKQRNTKHLFRNTCNRDGWFLCLLLTLIVFHEVNLECYNQPVDSSRDLLIPWLEVISPFGKGHEIFTIPKRSARITRHLEFEVIHIPSLKLT